MNTRDCALIFLFFLLLPQLNAITIGKVPGKGRRGWINEAKQTLRESLKRTANTGIAKNVILFIGDGMSLGTVTMGRILDGQMKGMPGEENVLAFEKFPSIGLAKTYAVDAQGADSAVTATAYLSGIKANYATLGIDESIKRHGNCSEIEQASIDSILVKALRKGKKVGVVTTTRITHASPAATYAHSVERFWEGDFEVKQKGCEDIASQFVRYAHDFDVVFGGGRMYFLPNEQPEGKRLDGRDLLKEWQNLQINKKIRPVLVKTRDGLNSLMLGDRTKYLGVFAADHLEYMAKRTKLTDQPTLSEMTRKAIELLQNEQGYVLFVEGGRIDHGHHAGMGKRAITEMVELANAIEVTLEMTSPNDTLIVLSADHSHSASMFGYSIRGNKITGLNYNTDGKVELDSNKLTYPVITYSNGPGAGSRTENLTEEQADHVDYRQTNSIKRTSATHSGEDVPIYSQGPYAHLLTGVVEQHVINHVMEYAGCIGEYEKREGCVTVSGGSNSAAYKLSLFHNLKMTLVIISLFQRYIFSM